jgi:hypothetical protein
MCGQCTTLNAASRTLISSSTQYGQCSPLNGASRMLIYSSTRCGYCMENPGCSFLRLQSVGIVQSILDTHFIIYTVWVVCSIVWGILDTHYFSSPLCQCVPFEFCQPDAHVVYTNPQLQPSPVIHLGLIVVHACSRPPWLPTLVLPTAHSSPL